MSQRVGRASRDRQQAGLRSTGRNRAYDPAPAPVADLRSRKPDHDDVGWAEPALAGRPDTAGAKAGWRQGVEQPMKNLFEAAKLLLLDMAATLFFLVLYLLTHNVTLSVVLGMALGDAQIGWQSVR